MKFVSGMLFTGKARGRTIVLITQPPEGSGVKGDAVSDPTVVARTSGADPFCDEVLRTRPRCIASFVGGSGSAAIALRNLRVRALRAGRQCAA